jgi:hypothetical protein
MTFSLDISTTCVGFALFNEDGKLQELNYVKFKDKLGVFEKLEEFKKAISHLENVKIKRIAIEEPLQRMQGKFSSAHTIAILNFFNGMVSAYVYSLFKVIPIHYNVNSIRSTVFKGIKEDITEKGEIKHKVWNKVKELEPQINWKYGIRSAKLLPENYDMSDAYSVGIYDFIILNKQLEKLEKK